MSRDPVDDLLAVLQMALGQTMCGCQFEHGTHSPGRCERRATAIIGIAELCPDCEQAWRRPCRPWMTRAEWMKQAHAGPGLPRQVLDEIVAEEGRGR